MSKRHEDAEAKPGPLATTADQRSVRYASDLTPMEFFARVQDGTPVRLANGAGYYPPVDDMKWAASQAAPYTHPRLSAIRTTDGSKKTHEQWMSELADDPAAAPQPEEGTVH